MIDWLVVYQIINVIVEASIVLFVLSYLRRLPCYPRAVALEIKDRLGGEKRPRRPPPKIVDSWIGRNLSKGHAQASPRVTRSPVVAVSAVAKVDRR